MQEIRVALRRRMGLAVSIGVLVALALSACGGSSSGGSSTATQANAAAPGTTASTATGTTTHAPGGSTTPSGGVGRSRGSRGGALRECMQRNGIKLPTQRGGLRGLFLGGATLPPGVTRSQLQAAIRQCVGNRFGGRFAGGPRVAQNPAFRQALGSFAACLRQSGVSVPSPNTSGKGPVFSTKGLDTNTPKFKAAVTRCRPALTAAFGRRR